MIKVCDSIMGSGKSSAAINYMNAHKHDKKFIYITPYLTETDRIFSKCKDLHFVRPSNKLKEFNFSKSQHTNELIKEGRNISTTHQAFKRYTSETLDNIKKQGYTLIIDESVSVYEEYVTHPTDLNLLIGAGYIKEINGVYTRGDEDYDGACFKNFLSILKSRELISMDNNSYTLYFWSLPPDLLTSFDDVYILTYMFKAQSLKYFMDVYNIKYTFIGVERTPDGKYYFCKDSSYIPEYVHHIKDKIHILDNARLNSIGNDYYALSKSWYTNKTGETDQLKNNISNCFNHIWRGVEADKRMWGAFSCAFNKLKGKGYTKSFVPFNERATNSYKNKTHLVYATNVFMNVSEKLLYQRYGVQVDEDLYALSTMVQWIWRSAIRDGQDIYLYIPSKRMRTLLINWIHSFDEGGVSAA